MLNNKKVIYLILINCLLITKIFSQSTAYNVFELTYLYQDARFEQILSQTEELLKNRSSLNKNQLIEIHKYRALSFFNTNQQDSSRIHFFSLLSLDKDYTLDPVKISPKIISFFEDIKNNFEMDLSRKRVLPYNNYIFVEDIRVYAALRSVAMPGWGQHYKNQTTKGYILNSSFALSAIATVISYSMERNLRDDYLAENEASKIKSLYTDYNNISKTRRLLQYSTIIIWIYSIVDALYSDYTPLLSSQNETLILSFNIPL